jgi:hypothetical protein
MVGQNLFNVYQKRSYSCEVEMLGCALIQPMMYFQLNNIPMFRGLYLIIKVSHNIKPNGMTTTFKGVRVKRTKTPLLTASDVLMTLLGDVSNNSSSNSNNSNGSGNVGAATNSGESVSSYYNNLKSEITTNPITKIIEGNTVNIPKILTAAETAISDWNKGTINEANNVNILQKYANTTPGFSGQEYADGTHWSATFVSHIMTYADKDFPKSTQHLSYIKSAMNGEEGYEAFPLKNNLRIKPEVGDIVCYDRNGGGSHCDIIYKIDGGKAHLIGGNLSDTVLDSINNTGYPKELGIGDGTAGNGGEFFKDMIYDSTEYYIIIKKTGNYYYNKKKLTSSSNGSGGSTGGSNSTSPNLGGPIGSPEAVNAANSFAASKGGFEDKGLNYTITFLTDVLKGLNIPSPNKYQLEFMKAWRQHEGAKATYNPFNTTKGATGARYYATNEAGVKNYADRAEGLVATIDTIKQSNFSTILNAIKKIASEDDISKTMKVVNDSPWGSDFVPPTASSWKTLNNFIWGYAND